MLTFFKTIEDIHEGEYCPLPISTIPNNMGINLSLVHAIGWQMQEDGQLVNLTIYFRTSNIQQDGE